MARSHSANPDFYQHCGITEKAIAQYQVLFDDSVKEYNLDGNPIPANKLHYEINQHALIGLCYGKFFFESEPQITLTLMKEMTLVKKRGKFESTTTRYSYNICFERQYKSSSKQHIVRWDNQDDTYGYSSSDHLHIQIDSTTSSHRKYSKPSHGDNQFPLASDVFELVDKLIQNEPYQYHEKLLTSFMGISNKKKIMPSTWTPILDKAISDNYFQDIYL